MTRLEIVVLAALSRGKPPTEADLAKDVQRIALPDQTVAGARTRVVDVLAELRARGLVEPERRALSAAGRDALREAFALTTVPTWQSVKLQHVPALALGLAAGSADASRALASAESIQAALLARQLAVDVAVATVRALCEHLLFEKLGLPAVAVKDKRLLAHVLAHRAGVEAKGALDKLAARLAAASVGARNGSKAKLVEALGRRWANGVPTASTARAPRSAPDATDMTHVADAADAARGVVNVTGMTRVADATGDVMPARDASAATSEGELRAAVKSALERVPSEGRFGSHKVFIASLWEQLVLDAQPSGMDLAAFKRWLVEENARQALVLARADMVSAMDPARVAASEIVDRGASFHFVLDER